MEQILCEVCGQIIGVYEPARAIRADGVEVIGARDEFRCELQTPGTVAVHEQCRRAPESVRQTT
jgi:hypothetical protein